MTDGHATPDGVDKYHREMAERERRGTEPGFKSQASSNREATCYVCGHDAGDNWFDRTLCACDTMHTRCRNCGAALDDCPYEQVEPHAIPKRAAKRWNTYDGGGSSLNCCLVDDPCKLHATRNRAADDAASELARAVSKFGPMASAHEGYAVILEELEELWAHVKANTGSSPEARQEAIQLAAMALRYVTDVCDA